MTPKDPFLEGTFWDKFWRPIRSRALLSAKTKRGRREGDGKKSVTTIYDNLRHFATFYDNFHLFIPLT